MGGREIDPGGVAHCRPPVVEDDQEERAQRHDLPRHQKQQAVMRRDHRRHARGQQVRMEPAPGQAAAIAPPRQVTAAVNRGDQRQAEYRQQKKRRERIDLQMKAATGHQPGRRHRFGLPRNENANCRDKPQHRSGDRAALSRGLAQRGTSAAGDRGHPADQQQQNCAEEFEHVYSRQTVAATRTLTCFQADPPPSLRAERALRNQLDPGGVERSDQLHQRIDIAADHPFARLHALDCRDGKPGELGQPALVDAEQCPGGAQLRSSYHV